MHIVTTKRQFEKVHPPNLFSISERKPVGKNALELKPSIEEEAVRGMRQAIVSSARIQIGGLLGALQGSGATYYDISHWKEKLDKSEKWHWPTDGMCQRLAEKISAIKRGIQSGEEMEEQQALPQWKRLKKLEYAEFCLKALLRLQYWDGKLEKDEKELLVYRDSGDFLGGSRLAEFVRLKKERDKVLLQGATAELVMAAQLARKRLVETAELGPEESADHLLTLRKEFEVLEKQIGDNGTGVQ